MSTAVDILATILRLRKGFESKKTRPVEWRKQQINQVKKLLTENISAFQESLQKDLGHKSQFFSSEIEIGTILGDIKKILENLDQWVKDEPRETPMAFLGSSSFVHFDPLGVVLIISPWNYPVSLVAQPLIGALAAGNCVLIKPSELAAHTSKVFATLIPKYLDRDAVAVVEGAVEETTLLLKQKWDHIIYTGNGTVGRIVMKAAAEHLTPVTLELGGKSPCIIDKSINVTVAATRIMWGKFLNCGQTCVAPDYVLVHKSREQEVLEAFKKALKDFYGDDPQKSPDYSRIINQRHCNRLAALIEKAKSEKVEIVVGGKVDPSDNYIAPTIIRNVQPKSVLMEDEIFGPILPILAVDSVEEAVDFINARDKPLALYIFSSNSSVQRFVIENTSSGGCVVNDCVAHVGNVNIPFGGVGPSGMGAYHGHTSFKNFSHNKAVLHRSFFGLDNPIRSPPYTSSKMQQFKLARKLEVSTSTLFLILGTLGVVLVGVGLAATGNGATVSNQAKRVTIEALTAVIKFLH